MTYRVVITETAVEDLREIAFRIAEAAQDKQAAKRFLAGLRAEIAKLDTFPNAGAVPRDRVLMSAGYRFTVHKDYLIFYTVEERAGTVQVMAVFHGKRDYMRVMRRFL